MILIEICAIHPQGAARGFFLFPVAKIHDGRLRKNPLSRRWTGHHTLKTLRQISISGAFSDAVMIRSRMVAFFLLLGSILAIYSNTLNVPWHFDDQHNITERKDLHLSELSWEGIKQTLFKGKRLYRPISCLSFALNHYVHELNVTGYHLVNISVHVMTAWFLFLFLYSSLKMASTPSLYRKNAFFIALLAALLWSVHPIQTQAVTYIVQRMASLAGMFYIMSMYFYMRARTTEGRLRCGLFVGLSLLAALMAFGSKENTILLPVSIALYELFVLSNTSIKGLLRSHWKLVILLLAVVTGGVLGYLELMQGGRVLGLLRGYEHRIFGLEERLLTEPRIVLFYISLLLYPHPSRLSISHHVETSTSLLHPPTTLLSIGLIVLLVAGAFAYRKRYPLVAFSIVFFFANHIVESTILPLELIFEHRNYIPSMLFFLPFAMLLARGVISSAGVPIIRGFMIALILAIPIGLGSAAYLRNFDWRSGKALWMDAAVKSPGSWRPFHNAGLQLLKEKKYAKALQWFRAALGKENTTLHLEKFRTHYNIGVTFQAMGMYDAALVAYRRALEQNPAMAEAHVNRGVILMDREKWSRALDDFQEALSIDPSLAEANSNLGWLLFQFDQHKEGLRHLRKAVRLNPSDLVTRKRLAFALLRQGENIASEKLLKGLLKDRPQDFTPLLFLTELYAKTGRMAEAKAALQQVARRIGKDGLSRLVQKVMTQGGHPNPNVMLPDRDTLMLVHRRLEGHLLQSPEIRQSPAVKQEDASHQQ